jgi:Transmembrane amino acid transporter protein
MPFLLPYKRWALSLSLISYIVKTIGMLGSIAIAVNSLAGPAILQLPFQFQQSGIIPTIACLLFISVLSACVCLHTANTISYIPNNTNFQKCIEFSDPYRYFINERMFTITQVLFLLTAVALNVAAIIDTAEGMYFRNFIVNEFLVSPLCDGSNKCSLQLLDLYNKT